MTYQELGEAIGRLSEIDKKRQAMVWPPEACPAADGVPVTELQVTMHKDSRTNIVTILTGKTP